MANFAVVRNPVRWNPLKVEGFSYLK